MITRHRNRPSNRRLKEDLENQVARILRDQYPDFGPTLAMEKLAERHQIVLAKETVRRIQIAAGLWIPRKLRPPKVQQPRLRRACVGELIQIDGCEHAWFEDRAPVCTALVFVDDATSRLMWVKFTGLTASGTCSARVWRDHPDLTRGPVCVTAPTGPPPRVTLAALAANTVDTMPLAEPQHVSAKRNRRLDPI